MQDDQRIIVILKIGDFSSFPALIRKYERQVYNHCLRMVHDPEESYDLTQEIFLRVYRNIGSYQHRYSFYTWLYRITVNCCIDYIRKRRRQPRLVSLSLPPVAGKPNDAGQREIPDGSRGPERNAMGRELGDILNAAIDQLSDKLRSIFILKEIEGFSYDEIAEILRCSRGTVKSRLFRARVRLRQLLAHTLEERPRET